MTPELPPNPRAELEAKFTAWLLGELSAEEAATVREMIAKDAELGRLRDRLSQTLNILRETIATPVGETPAQPAPLKLSPERREKLLAHFKTIAPKEFAEAPRPKISILIQLAAAIAILMVLAGLLLPALSRAKFKGTREEFSVANLNLRAPALAMPSPSQAPQNAAAPASDQMVLGKLIERRLAEPENKPAAVLAPSSIVLPQSGEQQLAQAEDQKRDRGIQVGGEFRDGNAPGLQQSLKEIKKSAEKRKEAMAAANPPPAGTFGFRLADKDTPASTSPQSPRQYEIGGGATESSSPPIATTDSVDALRNYSAQIGNASSSRLDALPPPSSAANGAIAFSGLPSTDAAKPAPLHGAERLTRSAHEPTHDANVTLSLALTPSIGEPASLTAAAPAGIPRLNSDGSIEAESSTNSVIAVTRSPDSTLEAPQIAWSGTANPSVRTTGVVTIAESVSKGLFSAAKPAYPTDAPLGRPALPAPVPQPEVLTRINAFTTFSLNISDVAFRLAEASLENGVMPEAASMRSEEFINAFDYRDPEPAPGAPIGFAWERARDPFAHNRDLLRFSIKTAAQGRQEDRPLNLVLLLDKSGSMERADRVEIIANALRVLAKELQPHDTLSVVVFARTARLFVDGVPGSKAGKIAKELRGLTPEGGTNLEEAMKLAYATALRHYLANGENRVVLLTDGAANLGNVEPAALKQKVEDNRKQGIALDCFGVGWDGYNDDLLETLSRAGNGRYGFINTPEEAATEFAGKLAGALRVAAADVKVQVEFNPDRVTSYRQIGYAKDQLKKEDFRDNNVKAAQIGAAESGNALYTVEINPAGQGPLGTVHVRFRVPGTSDYQEHEWTVFYDSRVVDLDKKGSLFPGIGTTSYSGVPLEEASPAMRLAVTAAEFSEWLSGSPYAGEVTPDRLLSYLRGVPQVYGADARPKKLEWMIRQAKSISGK